MTDKENITAFYDSRRALMEITNGLYGFSNSCEHIGLKNIAEELDIYAKLINESSEAMHRSFQEMLRG